MMRQPLILDLFAGAGGAGAGYARAGLRVVGCDLSPKPLRHNPHASYVGDALEVLDTLLAGETWHNYRLSDFAAIHASPPCQDYAPIGAMSGTTGSGKFPRLVIPVRERLERAGLPWVIENVGLSAAEMRNPVMLCGTALGLRVQRHRLFDSNALLFAPGPCRHGVGDVSVRRKRAEYNGTRDGEYISRGRARPRPVYCPAPAAGAAMGIDWMTMEELGEAIPPAYTAWLGQQLMAVVSAADVA